MGTTLLNPVAIGGLGGSGTRVVAELLDVLGYYLGDDLNEASDNLWFTLLFSRRNVLLESDEEFRRLARLFFTRMRGEAHITDRIRGELFGLARAARIQYPPKWLLERAVSFSRPGTARRRGQAWGWKEPNTHVVIDRLMAAEPKLRYIHMERHPLAMATSTNQNQLRRWGPIFLNRDVAVGPRDSLSYWCAAHRRSGKLVQSWPGRTRTVKFEDLVRHPEEEAAAIAAFLGMGETEGALRQFREHVRVPQQEERFRGLDLAQFEARDVSYIRAIGYAVL